MAEETRREEEIKYEHVPERIGPEFIEKLVADLQVDNPVDYSEKTLEQAKKEGPGEYVRWLLHIPQKKALLEQMGIEEQMKIIQEQVGKYGIDISRFENSENTYNILCYIANQLRSKDRNKLWEMKRLDIAREFYSNLDPL